MLSEDVVTVRHRLCKQGVVSSTHPGAMWSMTGTGSHTNQLTPGAANLSVAILGKSLSCFVLGPIWPFIFLWWYVWSANGVPPLAGVIVVGEVTSARWQELFCVIPYGTWWLMAAQWRFVSCYTLILFLICFQIKQFTTYRWQFRLQKCSMWSLTCGLQQLPETLTQRFENSVDTKVDNRIGTLWIHWW